MIKEDGLVIQEEATTTSAEGRIAHGKVPSYRASNSESSAMRIREQNIVIEMANMCNAHPYEGIV